MRRSTFIVFALAFFHLAGCGSDGAIEPGVEVFKSRGSVQCTGGGTEPEVMKGELINAGINVMSFSCGVDGLAHPAVCGASEDAGVSNSCARDGRCRRNQAAGATCRY